MPEAQWVLTGLELLCEEQEDPADLVASVLSALQRNGWRWGRQLFKKFMDREIRIRCFDYGDQPTSVESAWPDSRSQEDSWSQELEDLEFL